MREKLAFLWDDLGPLLLVWFGIVCFIIGLAMSLFAPGHGLTFPYVIGIAFITAGLLDAFFRIKKGRVFFDERT